jgi:hypothetical protein
VVAGGVGEQVGGGDWERGRGGCGARGEEEGERARGGSVVCGGEGAEVEVGEAEEGLWGRGEVC